jgi:hypothetical protein
MKMALTARLLKNMMHQTANMKFCKSDLEISTLSPMQAGDRLSLACRTCLNRGSHNGRSTEFS